MKIFHTNPFSAGGPEDGELDLNIIIPKMQQRIRALEAQIAELKLLVEQNEQRNID